METCRSSIRFRCVHWTEVFLKIENRRVVTIRVEHSVDGDEINMVPIFEMSEVPKYMRLSPAHRTISSEKLEMNGGDVTLSSQQFCILSGWLNDPNA